MFVKENPDRKKTKNKKKQKLQTKMQREESRFVCKAIFFMFGGCPYFLNKDLDEVYNKQLKSCDPANRKKAPITLPFSHLVCRNIGSP